MKIKPNDKWARSAQIFASMKLNPESLGILMFWAVLLWSPTHFKMQNSLQ